MLTDGKVPTAFLRSSNHTLSGLMGLNILICCQVSSIMPGFQSIRFRWVTDQLSHHQSPKHYQQIKMRNSYATRNNDMFGILGFLRREPSGRPGADRHLRFFSPKCYLLLEILSLQRVVRDADLFVESQSWKLSLAKQNAWTQRWVAIYDNYSPEFRKVTVVVGGSMKYPGRWNLIGVLEPRLSQWQWRWQWLHLHKKMWKIVVAPLEIRCELAAGKLQFLLSKLIAFSWQRLMNLRSLWITEVTGV